MSRTPTEQSHDPIFREIDLSAEIRRLWGAKWNSPELAYEFRDRKFYLRTEDAGIYRQQVTTTATGSILKQDGGRILLQTGDKLLLES